MAHYTTAAKICHEGNHEITDSPAIDNVGYKDPLTFEDELYASDGKAEYRRTYHKLCREHYLIAYEAHYPDLEQPAI